LQHVNRADRPHWKDLLKDRSGHKRAIGLSAGISTRTESARRVMLNTLNEHASDLFTFIRAGDFTLREYFFGKNRQTGRHLKRMHTGNSL
jgi:hypothetical protein